jgi:hypothetical protein
VLLARFVLWVAFTSVASFGAVPVGSYFRRRQGEIVAESSTAEIECDPELVVRISELFERGASEFFRDGMSSDFSRALVAILAQNGRSAFRAMAEYVFSNGASPDVVSEALRWMAEFDDPSTLPQRWAILQRTLRDRSPRVRDGAILGLASMNDSRALPLLLEAQKGEPVAELRRVIEQVVERLSAKNAAPPPNG